MSLVEVLVACILLGSTEFYDDLCYSVCTCTEKLQTWWILLLVTSCINLGKNFMKVPL